MDPVSSQTTLTSFCLRRLYVPPPDLPVSLGEAVPEARRFAGCLVHPLVARALGRCLIRREADAALRCAPLTLAEAAAALKEWVPDWAQGGSVARPWQDGRQASVVVSTSMHACMSPVLPNCILMADLCTAASDGAPVKAGKAKVCVGT